MRRRFRGWAHLTLHLTDVCPSQDGVNSARTLVRLMSIAYHASAHEERHLRPETKLEGRALDRNTAPFEKIQRAVVHFLPTIALDQVIDELLRRGI